MELMRILIVEDNHKIANSIKKGLEQERFAVDVAYTGPDGKIEILVQRNGDRCEISVADDGPGIPADQIDKIFHRFFRGEYARNAAGTGLGLNIARAIIERHAGEIIVQNRSTGGACFVVSLPGLEKHKSQQ